MANKSFDTHDAHCRWEQMVDEYFDTTYLPFHPTAGTSAGLHDCDGNLEDYSRSGMDAQIAALRAHEKKIRSFPEAELNITDAGDREFLLGTIQSELLTLETIRPWQKQPDIYSSGIAASAFTLISRDYALPEVRLRSLIEREKQMPAMLEAARKNLKNPPRVFIEIALEQLPGILKFFRTDIPLAFSTVDQAALLEAFRASNAAVVESLCGYQSWLQKELLPKSTGDYRIGAATFQTKLLCDELIDLPLDRLLEIAMADLRANQEQFRSVAYDLDPDKTPMQVLAELQANYPPPDQLLETFRSTFGSLIQFIRSKEIVSIPSDIEPTLKNTPPFMRAITFASMDSPGAYERGSKQAYFNVTVPSSNDTPQQIAENMAAFNIGTITSTSIHEAYPGHYVQFLFMPGVTSRVRKMLYCNTNVEGWAHYCEQMMLDQGYGQPGLGSKDERETKLIRLGQLNDALLRNARFVACIQMHTGEMTIDQAVEFFRKEGYQTRAAGLVEAKRAAGDPTYLYYTLGKLIIQKLRTDTEKIKRERFSLQGFHDRFLMQGGIPLPLVRRALLQDSSPVL